MSPPRLAQIVACLCLLAAINPRPAQAAEQKVLLVVLDKLAWQDLLSEEVQAPVLRDLADRGAVGMMCVRTARGYGGEYLTIGAGSRATSRLDPVTRGNAEAEAYEAREVVHGRTAAEVYTARTGWVPRGDSIVHLAVAELMRQNQTADYPLRLGLLGGSLGRGAGVRIACVGNADTPGSTHRELVAIAMDEHGRVPLGDVGGRLIVSDAARASGATLNRPALLSAFRRAAETADFVVLDPGETSRVEGSLAEMAPEAARAARRAAVEAVDSLLRDVLASLSRSEWAILIVTPSTRDMEPGEQDAGLTPIILWRPGQQAGLLSSPSTGRPGLVLNTDVAPTVLACFGIDAPPEMIGRPMDVTQVEGRAVERLEAELARHSAVEAARGRVFRALPTLAAVALWLAAFFVLVGERVPRMLRILVRAALLLVLSIPAAMLLVAIRPLSAQQILLGGAAAAVVVALVGAHVTGWRSGHALPCLLVVGLLTYDLIRGQQMLYWSALSYSPSAGARFYGIGNEFAGVLLGASLVGASSVLWPRDRTGAGERVLAAAGLLGLAALVGMPRFGANLGMSLAMAVGVGVFALYLWRREVGWWEALAGLLVAAAVVAGAVVFDALRGGLETSHIGRWVASVQSEGWQAVSQVLVRKVSMNCLLLRVSVWTDVAMAALGVLAVAVAARPPRVLAVLRERAWLPAALVACLAGAATALLLNDSGIVAASLALLYGAGTLAYLSLGDVGLEQ